MIISIDGYEANVEHRVGIGRYAYEILTRMYAIRKEDLFYSHIFFRVYLPQAPRSDMPRETSWWTYHIVKPKKLWTFIGFPFALIRDKPKADVVFSPTHYIPRFVSASRVMSIMDCSYLSYPELFKSKDLHQLVHWTKYAASHAKLIFTISEFSRNAIIKAYRVNPRRVVVTYPGLVTLNFKKQHMQLVDKKYPIAKHYILSVGTIQPRKNYERLIEAFALFLKKNKQKFGVIDLVIVGKKGWLYNEILHAPKRYGVEKQVKFLDFVPDSDLPTLYKNALCFALPSLYEGFGLPVLEAMAQGCPVVVSNSSSLPEIAGKAGVYVDPKNVESIASGLLTAVRQRNLIQGRIRVKKGLDQVSKFSWDKAAKETLDLLERVGKGTLL
ncbi:MAG: glycosyl transferase group 1 [Microgenomates group bacterium GW2011_GWC1_39_12]|nr:MAG: glycosyl transferase group 1 [Microgenomates group bacterium GW2011_GWC1_39_12]